MEAHTEVQGHPPAFPIPAFEPGFSARVPSRRKCRPSRRQTRRRERIARRALGLADIAASLLAAYLALTLLGRRHAHARRGRCSCRRASSIAAKAIGLYDRDELLIRKTTVEELPKLFQLSVLYALVFWLGDEQLMSGAARQEPGDGARCDLPGRGVRAASQRRVPLAAARPSPSASCSSATSAPTCACAQPSTATAWPAAIAGRVRDREGDAGVPRGHGHRRSASRG